jgi:hypothetical protein
VPVIRVLTNLALTVTPGSATSTGCSMQSPNLWFHLGVSNTTGVTKDTRSSDRSGGVGPGSNLEPCTCRETLVTITNNNNNNINNNNDYSNNNRHFPQETKNKCCIRVVLIAAIIKTTEEGENVKVREHFHRVLN